MDQNKSHDSENSVSNPSSGKFNRERFMFTLGNLVGSIITCTLCDRSVYKGVLYTTNPEKLTIVLNQAIILKSPVPCRQLPRESQIYIRDENLVSICANDISTTVNLFSYVPKQKPSNMKPRSGRTLVKADAWITNQEDTKCLEETDDGKPFDQFEVNRQMGYVSTYNENLYTTALDMSKFSKEDLERAERTEKEILAKSHKKIIFGQEVDPDNMDESPCEDYEEEEEISFPSPKPIFQEADPSQITSADDLEASLLNGSYETPSNAPSEKEEKPPVVENEVQEVKKVKTISKQQADSLRRLLLSKPERKPLNAHYGLNTKGVPLSIHPSSRNNEISAFKQFSKQLEKRNSLTTAHKDTTDTQDYPFPPPSGNTTEPTSPVITSPTTGMEPSEPPEEKPTPVAMTLSHLPPKENNAYNKNHSNNGHTNYHNQKNKHRNEESNMYQNNNKNRKVGKRKHRYNESNENLSTTVNPTQSSFNINAEAWKPPSMSHSNTSTPSGTHSPNPNHPNYVPPLIPGHPSTVVPSTENFNSVPLSTLGQQRLLVSSTPLYYPVAQVPFLNPSYLYNLNSVPVQIFPVQQPLPNGEMNGNTTLPYTQPIVTDSNFVPQFVPEGVPGMIPSYPYVYYQMQSDNQNTIPTTVSYNNNGTPNGIITLNGPNSFVPLPNMNSPPPRESNNTTSSTNSSAPASNNNTTRENNNREGSAKENNNNSNTSGLVRRNTKKRMNGYQKN